MPERWERELEKLNDVDAPVSTRARIAEGPHGEGVPPRPGRSQRIVAGVVAFAIFGGAVALAYGGFGSDGEPVAATSLPPDAVVVTFGLRNERVPVASLEVRGSTFEGFGTSTCFEADAGDGLTVSNCMDTVAPEDYETIVGPWEYASVVAGAPLLVEGTAVNVESSVLDDEFRDVGSLPLVDGVGAIPDEQGRRFLRFHAAWPGGDRSFYFPVEIVPASGVRPLVLSVHNKPPQDGSAHRGPSFTASYGITTVDLDAIETPGTDLYYPSVRFPIAIPVGTPLEVDHDGVDVDVFILERVSGELVGDEGARTVGDPIDALPTVPGVHAIHVLADWGDAVGGMGLEIELIDLSRSPTPAPGEPTAAPPTPTQGATDVVVPDLVGLDDQAAMQALNDLGLAWIVGYRAHPDVPLWVVFGQAPAPGSSVPPGSEISLEVATTIEPLPPGSADALSCAVDQRVAFGGPDARILPGGAAYIEGNLGGIERADDVVQITSTDQRYEWNGIWHVIRDGDVITVVDFESLDGVACRGFGVAGA